MPTRSLNGATSALTHLVVLQRSKRGRLLSAGLHNGSFLRSGQAVLFNILLKTDIHLLYGEKSVEIHSNLSNPAVVDLSSEEAPSHSHSLQLLKGESRRTHFW